MILGVEPWGRILIGVIELTVAILLLTPTVFLVGAVGTLVVGFGAILSHLLFIGVIFDGDVSLFVMAGVVFIFSLIVLMIGRRK